MQPRQHLSSAALALAFGLAATVFAGPSTAFAANPDPPRAPTSPGGEQAPINVVKTIDLKTAVFRLGTNLDPGETFTVGVYVENKGNTAASSIRSATGFGLPYSNVHVSSAPGFSCSVQTSTTGFLPGHWVICDGGPIPAGGGKWIQITAKAPQAAGNYKVWSTVDPQNLIAETNEGNNSGELTFHVQ
jgi:CARDB